MKLEFLGGTPLGMYKKIIELYKAGKVSFKNVITFNMDEYVGEYLILVNSILNEYSSIILIINRFATGPS